MTRECLVPAFTLHQILQVSLAHIPQLFCKDVHQRYRSRRLREEPLCQLKPPRYAYLLRRGEQTSAQIASRPRHHQALSWLQLCKFPMPANDWSLTTSKVEGVTINNGGSLQYPEFVVYREDAIVPVGLIMYTRKGWEPL